MADIEDVAMAEPDLARRPMISVWIEKVEDYLVRYRIRGDDGAAVAVAAEPQQHTRLTLIFLVTAGAVFGFFAYFYAAIKCDMDSAYTVAVFIAMLLCAGFALGLAGVSACLIQECQEGFQDEEHHRLADFLLQV